MAVRKGFGPRGPKAGSENRPKAKPTPVPGIRPASGQKKAVKKALPKYKSGIGTKPKAIPNPIKSGGTRTPKPSPGTRAPGRTAAPRKITPKPQKWG